MKSQIDAKTLEGETVSSIWYPQANDTFMYQLICTRRNVAFAVARLSQDTEHPTQSLWECGKSILQYVNGTNTTDLLLVGRIQSLQFEGAEMLTGQVMGLIENQRVAV